MTPREPSVRVAAIAGWTCTGKTRFAQALAERLRPRRVEVLSLDDFYRDTSHLSRRDRAAVDYDEPAAYDLAAFRRHLDALCSGDQAPRFRYDFASGARREAGVLGPAEVVLAEGFLTLWDRRLRRAADLRIFLEGDPERLLTRRVRRDGAERAYRADEVRRRFGEMVIPAQRRYLAEAPRIADLVFPMDWGDSHVARAAGCLDGDTSPTPAGKGTVP